MNKIYALTILSFLFIIDAAKAQVKPEYGYYLTKEDYLNKKITVQERMQESVNYNLGIIVYKDKKDVEHKIHCIKEKYWGFRYLDGCDYMYLDGFFAKILIVGRIDLLISPKAKFKVAEDGTYSFIPEAEGIKINYYFLKDLDPSTLMPFEKHIVDEKAIVKEYQADRDNYGEWINKQLKYLKKYNETIPKPVKGKKEVAKKK